MENAGHPSLPRERYEHTKEKFILKLEMAHANFLRTAWKYHILVGIVDSYGEAGLKGFGCTSGDHT